jgi:hypothetical protein
VVEREGESHERERGHEREGRKENKNMIATSFG